MDIWEFNTYCQSIKPVRVAFMTENQLEEYMLPGISVKAVYPEIFVFPTHNMVCIRGKLPEEAAEKDRNDVSADNMVCFDEIHSITVDEEESLSGTIVRLHCGYSPVPRMRMIFELVLTPAN